MRGTYDFISWLLLLTWAAAAKKSRATKNEIRSVDKKISSHQKNCSVLRFGAISLLTHFQLIHAQNETKSKLVQTSP